MSTNQPKTSTPKEATPVDKFAMPGQAMGARKKSKAASEYKKSLQEKQALKRLYGLSEKQFKKYVKDALGKIRKVENVSDELIKNLEKRLDNVVFRLGLAKTRAQSRQLVSHAYFLINGKPVNIPSFQVKKGDVIAIKESKKKKDVFKNVKETIKGMETPLWLNMNKESLQSSIVGEPSLAEVNTPVEISLIFEFYSR
jgi:small subunit ribosomal protein S4